MGEWLYEPSITVSTRETNIYADGPLGLARAKSAIDSDLATFADKWVQTYDSIERKPIEAFADILLRGGKRLRGILAMQSYYAHGGTDPEVAIGAARVSEIGQTYLLLIDDIQDKSEVRRGGPSAHVLLGSNAIRSAAMHGDLDHYGESQTINAALAGMHRADTELLALPADSHAILSAMRQMHLRAEITAAGQIKDIYNQSSNHIPSVEDIERVLTNKTAYYTFVGPLELGATLAGSEKLDENLLKYAINIGCAYQIADDVIGIFGETNETGKSNNDDIREGKMTLLTQYALRHADELDKILLDHIIGNETASDKECDAVREIMIRVGAREYCEARLEFYRNVAESALQQAAAFHDSQFIDFLESTISYASRRAA